MVSNKKFAIATGVFFIIATAMGVLNAGLIGPLVGSVDYLTELTHNADLVYISVMMNLIMAFSVVAIAVSIYPILKNVSEVIAIGYLAARIFEGILLALSGLIWFVLVPLGDAFIKAHMPDNSHFQALGDLLISLSTVGFTVGASIIFGITALILNYALYRYKLVPILISIWGFIAGALLLTLGSLDILGFDISAIEVAFTAPIALNEMVLAVWLIVKGFSIKKIEAPTSG